MGAELRPQLGDGSVVAEHAALGERVYHRRGYALADRETKKRRVRRHRTFGFWVGDTRYGVDHELTVPINRLPQAPLGLGSDQPVDNILGLLLDVVSLGIEPALEPVHDATNCHLR